MLSNVHETMNIYDQLARKLQTGFVHVHLLQGVVEGFYKHCVDPCTLSVYSSKRFQTYTHYVYYLQYSLCFYLAVTAGPLLWALGVLLGSTHQIHVCQRLHLVESEPLIVLHICEMIVCTNIYICICFTAIGSLNIICTLPIKVMSLSTASSSKRTLSSLLLNPLTCCCMASLHALSTCQVQTSFRAESSYTLTHAKWH